jgi:AraC-like DNA-binding protein
MKGINAKAQRSEGARRTASSGLASSGRLSTKNYQPPATDQPLRASAIARGKRRSWSCRLARIRDWPRLAHETKYSVTALAEHCKVCVRTLQSYFLYSLKEPPRLWIKRLRMERALELLRDGSNVNETAALLAYQNHGQFSRAFKRFYGFAPTKHANARPGVR